MEIKQAVMAFSQSEKIKSGLIWVSQALAWVKGLGEGDRKGAEDAIGLITAMLLQEIGLAKNVAGNEPWKEIESHVDQAIVMIRSGVAPEGVFHLTQALSKVTNIGQRSMSLLRAEGLI